MNSIEKNKHLIPVIVIVVYVFVAAYFFIFQNQVAVSMPDLTRAYTTPSDMPAEYAATMSARIKEEIANIQKDTNNITAWITLATLRKGVNDYVGAEQILLYVIQQNPKGLIAYNNLGNLYASYLNQPKKAEKAFLKVIELDSSYIAGYRNLYDLYRSAYKKDSSAAKNILERGLKANTENIELLMMLGALSIEQKDNAGAKAYFERALKQAENGGNTDIAAFIKIQIEKLK